MNDKIDDNDFSDDPKLTAFVLGELSVEESAEVERAIDRSPELATAVAEIRATVGTLQDMFAGEPNLTLSGSAIRELRDQSGGLSNRVEIRRPWVRWLLAACVAAILIGGTMMLPNVQQVRESARRAPQSPGFYDNATDSARVGGSSVVKESEIEREGLQRDLRRFQENASEVVPTDRFQELEGELSSNLAESWQRIGTGLEGQELPPAPYAYNLSLIVDGDETQQGERDGIAFSGEGELAENEDGDQSRERYRLLNRAAQGGRSGKDLGRIRSTVSNRADGDMAVEKSKLGDFDDKSKDAKAEGSGKNEKTNGREMKPRTWKRVKAVPNTTRLMVGDKDELDLTGMQVNVQIDGFRARVLIDYLYYNDRDRQLEGNFKLRLPEDSSLYYFAFGESANELTEQRQLASAEFIDNTQLVSFSPATIAKTRTDVWRNVKEARMVPREKAAYAFRETVRRRVDPALVEWSGAGVFNAKVFPLSPKKVHRIVVGYDVNLTRSKDHLSYRLDLPQSSGDCKVEINAQDLPGITYDIKPSTEPVEVDFQNQLYQRFTYDARPDETIELTVKLENETPWLLQSESSGQNFWATQVAPDLPVEAATEGSSRAIFLLDTSLSSSPDKLNVWLKLLESTLVNNRDSIKEFGVLLFSVDQHFWHTEYRSNDDKNLNELKAKLDEIALEGATDLFAALKTVTTTDWINKEGDSPDYFLLSDGASNWGETNLRQMGRLLSPAKSDSPSGGSFGSLFAYQTGLTGTAVANLRYLTSQTGGAVFSVATEDQIEAASTAHRKRPWRLKSISALGASDFLSAGRVQWIYPGQTITIAGRGKVEGEIVMELAQGDTTKSFSTALTPIASELAPRLYGQISVGQLENLGSAALDVSAAYARHFRITGQTCSLLMLESEADYQRFEIKPEEDEFVIKSKFASKLIYDLEQRLAQELADPKAQLLSWLQRLEAMQGVNFKMSTALKLALDDMSITAVTDPLDCRWVDRSDLSKGYLAQLEKTTLEYDVIAGQAKKRGRDSIDDSIKVFSSLIERNPGDVIIARDVAFTAMELDRPAQAYYLLRSVAQARPFQGSIYPAIGQCLAQLGQSDLAIVYYEVALGGQFQRQGSHFRQIVTVDYSYLLRQIVAGELESSVKDFAEARLETLSRELPFKTADLLVTMMWNQDQTDVDLHVTEPSGEKCFYKHQKTNSGGEITSDITTGFGPEMYFNASAPAGSYKVAVKFYGSGQNRTRLKNKVYFNIVKDFGTPKESRVRKTLQLKNAGEFQDVMTVEL